MSALETAALYDAWQNKHGDFSDVPMADDPRRRPKLRRQYARPAVVASSALGD